MILLFSAVLSFLQAQDTPEEKLAQRCDSEIPWITDGAILPDNEWKRRILRYEHDRDPLLEEAQQQARERKRLILWFCPRVPGAHMYRAKGLEDYAKIVFFTDPGVVDLIRSKFVPLRMCCDENLAAATGIRRFEFVEPGFIVMTPDGKIVHVLDRIRTFNADWLRSALVAVLQKFPEYDAPSRDPLPDGTRSSVQKGRALLAEGKLDDARRVLEPDGSAEAHYLLASVDYWSGRDPEPRLRLAMAAGSESRWAWRAAANLRRGPDGELSGPLPRGFEDVFAAPNAGPATATRVPNPDVDATVRRAVSFLLRAQRANGSWNDARFPFSADAPQLPNYWMSVTALALLALSEWQELDPERIGAAVKRGETYLLDERQVNRGKYHESYADAYRLLYLARTKNVAAMTSIARRLGNQIYDDGFWSHGYPNTFTTAAVMHCLAEARKAGAEIPDGVLRRGADALEGKRGPGGRFAYNSNRGPSSEKDSMSRKALCELVLFEQGRSSRDEVAKGVDYYWKHLHRLEAIRACDFHADGELGGFTFFHAALFTCEAARALEGTARRDHLDRFRRQMLSIPELDGSFMDSHDLGKSYGTANALLILSRTR